MDDDQIPAKRNRLATVETYEVEKRQFDRIEEVAANVSLPFSFALALLPVAITLSVTLATVAIHSTRTDAIVWALMAVFYITGIFCALLAFHQRGHLKMYMREIRDQQVAPVAAKGATTPPDLTPISNPDTQTLGQQLQRDEGDDDN